MSKFWKGYRYELELLGCRILERAVPLLSRRGCVAVGQVLGMLAYWLDGRGRPVALANIEAALGDALTPEERRSVVRMSYQNFVNTMLALFWSRRITSEIFRDLVEPVGFEALFERADAEGRGIVFILAHQGNWEWASLAVEELGRKAHIVAEDFKNPLLTELFSALRSRGHHKIIAQGQSFLKLLRTVLRGEYAALLGDLTFPPGGASVVVRAFETGGRALDLCATRLPAVLGKRGGALVVPVLTEPLCGGRLRVKVQPPLDAKGLTERELSQKLWAVFEAHIRERPELWLWAYKHFRFRPVHPEKSYPPYAAETPVLEDMRAEV